MGKALRWATLAVLVMGCSGTVESANGGSACASGVGGSAAMGGAGGSHTGGTGASAGQAGNTGGNAADAGGGAGGSGAVAGGGAGGSGADAGASGQGATGGSAGYPPAPQCKDDSQCILYSDCCTCVAMRPGDPVEDCPITCVVDKCTELGISQAKGPRCLAGHCAVGFDCDAPKVLCNALPPQCEAGEVPSVNNLCWGPCVPASQCAFVPNCSNCDPKMYTCVTDVGWVFEHHCVPTPQACKNDLSCECMQNAVCLPPFDHCSASPTDGVFCECTNC